MARLLVVITVFLFGLNGFAGEIDRAFSGTYAKNAPYYFNDNQMYQGSGSITIRLRNNVVVVIDITNDIKYSFDLNNPETQMFPVEFMERFKEKGEWTKLVNGFSISESEVSEDGKSVEVNLNIHVGFSSSFGNIELLKVTFPTRLVLEKDKCSQFENYFGAEEIETSCVRIVKLPGSRISELRNNFGATLENVWVAFFNQILQYAYPEIHMFEKASYKVKQ